MSENVAQDAIGERITHEQLSEITGLTERHLRRLAKDGHFPPPHNGTFATIPALQGVIAYYRTQHKKNDSRIWDEKLARETAERKRAELELAEMSRAVLPADAVERAWSHAVTAVRARMLQMPDKFAIAWVTWQTAGDCRNAVEKEVRDAMQEMADQPDYRTAGEIAAEGTVTADE